MNRSFPTGGKYCEVLQNPALCFSDPELKSGRVRCNALGMPQAISGNFASVFRVTTESGRSFAIKCFTRPIEHQDRRYAAISERLAQLDRPWKVGFEFQSRGILVEGQWYAILKMEWVEAQSLLSYLDEHVNDPARILGIAHRFAAMVADLTEAGLAHGDLQHGNVLVGANDELRLVDYDGMFVPGLSRLGASEVGHPNYQPPWRSLEHFGPRLDRFSAWVIYGSLVALAIEPALWTRLRSPGDECLLFGKQDFSDPEFSAAIDALEFSGSEELATIAALMKKVLSARPEVVPAFDPRHLPVASEGVQPVVASGDPQPVLSGASPAYAATQPPITFQGSGAAARPALVTVVSVGLAAVAAPVALPAAGIPAVVGSIGSASLLAVAITRQMWLFLRTPERRAKTDHLRSLAGVRRKQAKARAEQARLSKALESTTVREDAEIAEITRKQQQAQSDERAEIERAVARIQRRIAEAADRIAASHAEEEKERTNAVDRLLGESIDVLLAAEVIPRLSGIGARDVEALNAAGIRTAADFSGVALDVIQGTYRQTIASLTRPTGPPVQIEGIGPVKADMLDRWRTSVIDRLQSTRSAALPPAEEERIRTKWSRYRRALAEEEARDRAELGNVSTKIRAKWQAKHAKLDVEPQRIRRRAQQTRSDLTRRIAEAERQEREAQWRVAVLEKRLASYREITFGVFMRRVVTGK